MNTQQKLAHYSIIEEIGRGGMGIVYRAQDLKLNREVALKVIMGDNAQSSLVQRFMREAKIMAKLKHPNIINILDVGFSENRYFFSMDYIPGSSLEQIMKSRRFSIKKAVDILIIICQAVHIAHKKGVVHRDLKPANIMLKNDKIPIVMDFGIALSHDESVQLSRSRDIMGTLSYMSPEQLEGKRKQIDHRTDVYALGVIMYRLLTGQNPFIGSSTQLIKKIIEDDPTPLHKVKNNIDRDLDYICLKALNKNKRNRYIDCNEMAEDLTKFSQGKKINRRFQLVDFRRYKKLILSLCIPLIISVLGFYFGRLSPSIDIPQNWNSHLWQQCWEGKELGIDFTKNTWKELPLKQKLRNSQTYQSWYARKMNLPVTINWKVAETSIAMTLIPPGQFEMGHNKQKINISYPFYICQREISIGEWQSVLSRKRKGKKSFPITNISRYDIYNFCFLSQMQLPNEAEWEYACRSGTNTPFFNGNKFTAKDFFSMEKYKIKNAWLCYGMHENVNEWCLDQVKVKKNNSAWLVRGGENSAWRDHSNTPQKNLGFRPMISLLSLTQKKEIYIAEDFFRNKK